MLKNDPSSHNFTPSESENMETVEDCKKVEEFTSNGFKILMEAIKHSNSLPSGRDWDFYNAFDAFPKIMNSEGANILDLMNNIMDFNGMETNIKQRTLDDKTELVIEANDVILEKAANSIDEMNGIKKNVQLPLVMQTVSAQLPVNGSWNNLRNAKFTINSDVKSQKLDSVKSIKLITAKNIVRPQKFFKEKIDNSNTYPWQPRITEKPNSLKPLSVFLEECEDRQEFSHPYEYELERFTPSPNFLSEEAPVKPKSLAETPLIEVSTVGQLNDLVETLRTCKEFAVDVEHHSYRTFMGITCLIQISTKDEDYIIDTLCLRDKLFILNEVFTKPSILKIFHGADKDIEWLQRDLSVYVVNMFDTHQAAKALEYSALSLAFLLKKFCGVNPNKQFQLADWRIRPLPEELKSYAREDTHYLIYIYQMLKNELILKGSRSDKMLKVVFDQSTDICKRRYFKPIRTDESHLVLYRRFKKMFDNRQLYALKCLYAWRDQLARDEDESIGYVLPNHMLLQISELLPREMQGILACCSPIPPLVRSNLLDIHQIILKARDQPLEKPILQEDTRDRGNVNQVMKVNMDSPLHCPHDLTKANEFRDDLPTLLNTSILKTKNVSNVTSKLEIEKGSSMYSIFNPPSGESLETINAKARADAAVLSYLSPFQRYKLVKPFVQAEEQRAAEKKAEEEKQAEEARKAKETNLKIDEDRTDEERIASIREHFLQMSQKFNAAAVLADQEQQEEEERSLVQMGGSKKRKREPSPDFADGGVYRDLDTFEDPQNQLHTPLPSFANIPNRAPKRKSSEYEEHQQTWKESQPESSKQKKLKVKEWNRAKYLDTQHFAQDGSQTQDNQTFFVDSSPAPRGQGKQQKKNKRNVPGNQYQQNHPPQSKRSRQQGSPQLQQHQQPQQEQQQIHEKQHNQQKQRNQQQSHQQPNSQQVRPKKMKKRQQSATNLQQQQQQQNYPNPGKSPGQKSRNKNNQQQGQNRQRTQPQQQGHIVPQQIPKQKKKKNKNRSQQQQQQQQNADFVPYDYSSVDFRQFQGGAGGVDPAPVSQQKGQGKKKFPRRRGDNRSATFPSNRGRGRGR